jgi:hypothetical protein
MSSRTVHRRERLSPVINLWNHDLKFTTRRTGRMLGLSPQIPLRLVEGFLDQLKKQKMGDLGQEEIETIANDINMKYRHDEEHGDLGYKRRAIQTIDKISAELYERVGWGSCMVKVTVDQWETTATGRMEWDSLQRLHGPSTNTWWFWLSEGLRPVPEPVDDASSQLNSFAEEARPETEDADLRSCLTRMSDSVNRLTEEMRSLEKICHSLTGQIASLTGSGASLSHTESSTDAMSIATLGHTALQRSRKRPPQRGRKRPRTK